MTSRAVVVACTLAATSCGVRPLMQLPAGPGAPAADATAVLSEATTACRRVQTLTAEVAVTGSAGGRRIRGRLSAGVASPASARLEAVAPFGPPIFIFVAINDDATLMLPRDGRVLEHGQPADVLEAVAGVPLGAADLRDTLTGCVPPASQIQGRRMGDNWRLVTTNATDQWYLHRQSPSSSWCLVAAVRRPANSLPWQAEWTNHEGGMPRSIRVTSLDPNGKTGSTFDLHLTLSQVDMNTELGPEVFRVQIPPRAEPITIEVLRRSGPLASTTSNGR